LTWGQEHRPNDSFVGFALPNNGASRRILEKIGMEFLDYRQIAGAFYELKVPNIVPLSCWDCCNQCLLRGH
jgi:RimJ/RimL family protein N-acetyltransferase